MISLVSIWPSMDMINFGHSLGHGVGLVIHEAKSFFRVRRNFAYRYGYNRRPGVYISQIGGVRIEDLVIVTDRGL